MIYRLGVITSVEAKVKPSSEAILTDNDPNQINILETEEFLPPLKNIIYQNQLQNWMLFIEELYQNFGSSNLIKDIAIALNNLQIKTDDKIATYNIKFMRYSFQLGWEDNMLCYRYY